MYNGVPSVVSVLPFLQKPPSNALEMVVPSPREGTARARAPRLNRGLKQRYRSRLVESTTDVDPARAHVKSSIYGALEDAVCSGCRKQRGGAPPHRGLRAATSAAAAASRAAGCARRPSPCCHGTHGPALSHCGLCTGKLRAGRGEPYLLLGTLSVHERINF